MNGNIMAPEDLIVASLIEKELGVPGKYGAWWTARELLKLLWTHKPDVIRDASYDLRELPFTESARDIVWRRALEAYMIGKTVHHFDKNCQYLSACRGVNMGIGEPVHLILNESCAEILPGLPGIYRVSHSKGTSAFDGVLFPEIIEQDQEWITNDVLVYALSRGYSVHVKEAYVFENYAKILDKWAAKLWNARQAVKPVNERAYQKLKAIAHIGVGSFATGKEKHAGIDLIHPNWWGDAVGKSRVNILCNMEKYGAPVLVETDGLYFVSSDADYRTAIPGILDRIGESGGYKHESSFTLTPEIYEQCSGVNPGQLAAIFKKSGNE